MPQYAKIPVKDAGIDQQILQLHEAMAKKCFVNPELFEQVEARIEARYAAKQMRYGAYLTWLSILELKHQPEQMLDALLERSFKMRNLRRATVFTGVLDENERLAVIESLT
jgi:hypothetical protein